jgi:hypothetical protein
MHTPEQLSSVNCKNCEIPFEGKFCPNCAQRADTHRFSVAHFGHEFFHAFTHTDRGILLLVKELLYRPGVVAIEYNAGKRKKYFNPITFLLIVTAVQFFVSKQTEIFKEINKATKELTMEFAKGDSEEAKKQMEESFKNAEKQSSLVEENSKAFTLLLIPILSFFSWLLFRKSGHNYAENLVLNVLIIGGTICIFFIFGILPFLFFPLQIVLWMAINFTASFVYYIIAYKQFFKQSWGITIFKGIIMQIIILICSQVITLVVLTVI